MCHFPDSGFSLTEHLDLNGDMTLILICRVLDMMLVLKWIPLDGFCILSKLPVIADYLFLHFGTIPM